MKVDEEWGRASPAMDSPYRLMQDRKERPLLSKPRQPERVEITLLCA